MKKTLAGFGAALLIAASAFAITLAHNSQKSQVCPDRPGCICSKPVKTSVAQNHDQAPKQICPDRPGCICSK